MRAMLVRALLLCFAAISVAQDPVPSGTPSPTAPSPGAGGSPSAPSDSAGRRDSLPPAQPADSASKPDSGTWVDTLADRWSQSGDSIFRALAPPSPEIKAAPSAPVASSADTLIAQVVQARSFLLVNGRGERVGAFASAESSGTNSLMLWDARNERFATLSMNDAAGPRLNLTNRANGSSVMLYMADSSPVITLTQKKGTTTIWIAGDRDTFEPIIEIAGPTGKKLLLRAETMEFVDGQGTILRRLVNVEKKKK